MKKQFLLSACLLLTSIALPAQNKPVAKSTDHLTVCAECIRKNMEFLASDELRGRGSGTEDEHKAAEYIGSQLKAYGIQPAGDRGGFVQQVTTVRRKLTGNPELKLKPSGSESSPRTFTFGKDFLALYLSQTKFTGPLKKIDVDKTSPKIEPGTVVLITSSDPNKARGVAFGAFSSGALAALVPAKDPSPAHFEKGGSKLPKLPARLEGQQTADMGSNFSAFELSPEAIQALTQTPENTQVEFEAPATEEKSYTWNAVGILPGSDPALQHAVVLFSAHLDHLGVGRPVNGDSIYNGADDDASGTTAVMEIARVLGAGAKPKRTVIFALFGSEEAGGLGSTYFREKPPVPLPEIAANLEFEMIGRADPVVPADTLWLTGWERSNLGPTLAAHGAKLVGDPHPQEEFFARSDNYVLAKKGVVAQTISSYGLHKEYHQPSDDIAHIDFKHMNEAIGSLLAPVEWLVNSDFKPKWNEGGQP